MVRGNSELSGVSATSLSADQVSVAGSITGDDITIDGNVVVGDIGSPAGKVAIKQGPGHWLTLFRSNGDYWSIHNPSEEDRLSFGLVKTDGSALWGLLTIHDNGNVGIGATNGANEKLAVGGNVRIDGSVTTQERVSIHKGWGNWLQFHTTNGNGYWRFHNPENQDKLMLGLRDGDGNEHWDYFVINNNGNVGIGTNDPGSNKLAVERTIGCRKLRFTTDTWADDV